MISIEWIEDFGDSRWAFHTSKSDRSEMAHMLEQCIAIVLGWA